MEIRYIVPPGEPGHDWSHPSCIPSEKQLPLRPQKLASCINQEHSLPVEGKICLLFRMAGRVQARRSGTKRRQRLRREEESLKEYVLLQAYLLMAVTGLGYLALTWSTVVLLGGFVGTLGKKDFWCLTAISMILAARSVNS
jgi:hypothetical protein